jgi:hypothetical protein
MYPSQLKESRRQPEANAAGLHESTGEDKRVSEHPAREECSDQPHNDAYDRDLHLLHPIELHPGTS